MPFARADGRGRQRLWFSSQLQLDWLIPVPPAQEVTSGCLVGHEAGADPARMLTVPPAHTELGLLDELGGFALSPVIALATVEAQGAQSKDHRQEDGGHLGYAGEAFDATRCHESSPIARDAAARSVEHTSAAVIVEVSFQSCTPSPVSMILATQRLVMSWPM